MKSDTALDYAVFQLSPKRSRCELFVSRNGNTEKIASGLVKPFATHLKIAEEQVALAVQSIKLEIDQRKNGEIWFTKGTLERFVRFVSTPEVLEMVNTFDAEMSQLESARIIYSQGVEDRLSRTLGGSGSGNTAAAADPTKKELLRAIDVRLAAVKQDLNTASARAAAAGFDTGTITELQVFADHFGAYRLKEACSKFISLCERRPDLIKSWKSGVEDRTLRSSYGSDMSIDDDSNTRQPSGPHQPQIFTAGQELDATHQQPSEQPKSSSWQQANSSSITSPLRRSRESSIEKENTSSVREKEESGSSEVEPPATRPGPPVRQLSVQDRISLFENKQKETSTTSSGSGGKPIVAKSVELRRQSSDMSSGPATTEKTVLRRWSGVSDMSISIDLSCEKKEVDSPLGTPSVSSACQGKSEDDGKRSDTATSNKPDLGIIPSRIGDSGSKDQADSSLRAEVGSTRAGVGSGIQLVISSGRPGDAYESDKMASTFRIAETQSSSSFSKAGVKDHATSQSQALSFDRADRFGFKNQGSSKGSYGHVKHGETVEQDSETQIDRLKEGVGLQIKRGAFASTSGDVRSVNQSYQPSACENLDRGEDFESRNQSVLQTRLRAPVKTAVNSGQLGDNSGSKIREAFVTRYKGTEGVLLDSQSSCKSLVETEKVEKQALESSKKQSDSYIPKVEDSGIPRMKFQNQVSAREHIRKSKSRMNESGSVYGTSNTLFSGKTIMEDQEGCASTPVTSAEPVQWIRQLKGNQDLNDELKMKANELEKLFAEHKLRAPGDQSNSTRRNKPPDMQIEQASSLPDRRQVADITTQLFLDDKTATDSFGSSRNVLKLNAQSVVKSVDSQDYDETIKFNISENGLLNDSRGKFYDTYMQKRDAKLREEWDSRKMEKEATLKAMQDSFERSRTEMMVNFLGSADGQDSVFGARRRAERLRSFNIRSSLKMEQSEDDEDPFELPEQKSIGNGIPRSSQTKRLLPNRNLSSSAPRTSAAPVPKSATKASNSGSVRRRMQSETPLEQLVPNFADLRKENTKPYSTFSKIARPQVRNYARTRSTGEEIPHAKEEKAKRPQSLRKSTLSPAEFKDISPLNPELKFDIDQTEQSHHDKFSKSMVKDEDEEEFPSRTAEDHGNMDHREPSPSQESVKLVNSGSENEDGLQSFSQVEPSLFPSYMPSAFLPVGSLQDSPGESPRSWNSRIHHPFSYPQEVSDVDASADSPLGSPASWNLHPLNQTEADAARMRKKWGSAQKTIIGANSSHSQSRKDVTRGFKRLLKFGRKSRGTESLADWISATTSEGDDDTEDGRDPANRSSEDLRKSRMGFAQGHASEESFNESEFFSEQVQDLNSYSAAPPANFKLREDHLSGSSMRAPRSFFSLSSFRSKGGESKLR